VPYRAARSDARCGLQHLDFEILTGLDYIITYKEKFFGHFSKFEIVFEGL
jgi:hypothetical protein